MADMAEKMPQICIKKVVADMPQVLYKKVVADMVLQYLI